MRDGETPLSRIRRWAPPEAKEGEGEPAQRHVDFRVPGAALRTVMNERSFLTFGLQRPPEVLIEGTTPLLPLAHRIDNVISIETKEPLASGFAWPESLERFSGAVYLASERVERGRIVTFADEPHFRLFWKATLPPLLNAVIYSPSFQ
jgi:hypothetical protein